MHVLPRGRSRPSADRDLKIGEPGKSIVCGKSDPWCGREGAALVSPEQQRKRTRGHGGRLKYAACAQR